MFKIESIKFWNKSEYQEYSFSENTFIYGMNTVGKTAMTKLIDYVLGSSEGLTYQGLDNIDTVEAHLSNDMTNLWIKRNVAGQYFYRRTEESDYSTVSIDKYKENICLILSPNQNNRYIEIYSKAFDEHPSFRSFNFLNYIEEKGLGDLSIVFTKAKELKHLIRIRNIMNFFFNYDNVEQIFEKEVLLDSKKEEYNLLIASYQEYNACIAQQKKLFYELKLPYTGDYNKDFKTFTEFKHNYTRTTKKKNKDLVYLLKASYSLSEEIKFHTFMKDQTENMVNRHERIKRLLAILNSVVDNEPKFSEYIDYIKMTVKQIDSDNVILSLTDYDKSIRDIQEEKERIDSQIQTVRFAATELSYEEAIKKVGLLENAFAVLKANINIERIETLKDEIDKLKMDIKSLRSSFNQNQIKTFNDRLTSIYLNSGLKIKHLTEDFNDDDFSLEFDPFRVCLFAKHKENGILVKYVPGSMTRLTHFQILTYLTMFEYLKNNFKDFIYMPLLIIDSANQPMGFEIFEQVYPEIIKMAQEIKIQTIFLSKDKINGVNASDLIDISGGLNKFHNM